MPLPRNLQLIVKSDGSFESRLDTASIALPAAGAEGEAALVATSKAPQPAPLVPRQSALIVFIAVVIGGVVGGLTFCAAQSLPQASLAGLAGAAGALVPLDKMIMILPRCIDGWPGRKQVGRIPRHPPRTV